MGFSVSREPREPESLFPKALDGLSHEEAGRVLNEMGKIGGINDTHNLLEAAGISRDAARVTEVMAEAAKSFPVIVKKTIGDGVESIKESQDNHQQVIKESVEDIGSSVKKIADDVKALAASQHAHAKRSRKTTNVSSEIDIKSCLIGAVGSSLIILPITWFAVVPSIVKMENGSDWALKQYYNSAEGRQARAEFKLRCKGIYPCPKKNK